MTTNSTPIPRSEPELEYLRIAERMCLYREVTVAATSSTDDGDGTATYKARRALEEFDSIFKECGL